MALSAESVLALGDALSPEFVRYVQETRDQQLGELLADAAMDFINENLGEVDDALLCEVATHLVISTGVTLV
jgi:hypothetical protein